MGQPETLDVKFAALWLADLEDRLEPKADENPQQLALSQFFTLNDARNRWDPRTGKFDHAIAVLAVDRGVPFTRKAGLAATFITLGLPDIKPGVTSVWARVMSRIWTNEIDMFEVQRAGIYQSLDALKRPRPSPHRAQLPPGKRDKDLHRGMPLTRGF